MKLVRADGTVAWDENGVNKIEGFSRNQPEIDRTKLRDILIDAVQPESIKWGKKLDRVEPEGKKYTLHFAGGEVVSGFDLVVGADGAWSKVRALVTDEKPFYSGITVLDLTAVEVIKNHQWLSEYAGAGSLFMFDDGRAIVCQRNGGDKIRVYACVRQPETILEDCGIDWEQPAADATKLWVEKFFADCGEDLKRAVVEASDILVPRALWMMPVGTKWEPRAGITLLGDAAHLMTPFAGVGVNTAMADALDLAKALLKRKDAFGASVEANIVDALKEYEEPMFVRGQQMMERTYEGLKGHFSSHGIDERLHKLSRRAKMIEEAKKARISATA